MSVANNKVLPKAGSYVFDRHSLTVIELLGADEKAFEQHSGQKLPALQAVMNFGNRKSVCHRFELRFASLSITLLYFVTFPLTGE